MADLLDSAIRKCPFLAQVAANQGCQYARHIAVQPAVPVGRAPLLEESYQPNFEATFRLFHGPTGVVPLARCSANPSLGTSPYTTTHGSSSVAQDSSRQAQWADADPCSVSFEAGQAGLGRPQRQGHPLAASAASISLSGPFGFLPGPGDLFGKLGKKKGRKPQPSDRKPADFNSSGKGSRSSTGRSGPGKPAGSLTDTAASASSAQPPGKCPLRRFAKPLGGLIALNSKGQLQCPSAIIKLRAAVARLKPVRELRPQALPIKMVAISAMAAGSNLPFGALREHTEKFSLGWFVAVHATIPFVAVLRKAVVMPRWAIALTITGAIIGQAIGARVERHRMMLIMQERGLAGSLASSSCHAQHGAHDVAGATSQGAMGCGERQGFLTSGDRAGGAASGGLPCMPGAFGALDCRAQWQAVSGSGDPAHRSVGLVHA